MKCLLTLSDPLNEATTGLAAEIGTSKQAVIECALLRLLRDCGEEVTSKLQPGAKAFLLFHTEGMDKTKPPV